VFKGQAISLAMREPGICELKFDLQGESVNKFNQLTIDDLDKAVAELEKDASVKGLLVTSGKSTFIVGADINEFLPAFKMAEPELAKWIGRAQKVFSRLEDLPFPSVAAINGHALGGGMELSMACTYRVASMGANLGQPEVKLGLIPGFGGTVRLPRLIGGDNAVDLIASGRDVKPEEALKLKLISAAVAPDKLEKAALAVLKQAMKSDAWKKVVEQKKSPTLLNGIERIMSFTTSKGFVAMAAGPNYPAPVAAVSVMEKAAADGRDAALEKEAAAFAKMAKTPEAEALIGIFHADQFIKKLTKQQTKAAHPVKLAGVLGAGIMGGGIAYQSASRGVPIVMKDIRHEALEQGLNEAARLLGQQVERGRLTRDQMAHSLGAIQAVLTYGEFGGVDVVVEAVVENPKIKAAVLAETEAAVKPGTILATNTSTISIDLLAAALKDKTRFCGMHFFNPVHRMPLVEVIQGKASSPEALATVTAYALTLGKTPILVKDGPGFLVNRILFPYLFAFQMLVAEGVPIEMLDKTMEKFGWPMGPAYLSDVIGLDTAHHAAEVMAAGFSDRMSAGKGVSAGEALFKAGYMGQKNGKGFYSYKMDAKGRPQKTFDPGVLDVIKPAIVGGGEKMSGEEIVERMMLPMVIEASRCLEDGIVGTPTELDMALIMGLGFPPFRGGLMRYADRIGVGEMVKSSERYGKLGPLYSATGQMKDLAKQAKAFYPA
jgi:3-hydroxyacyl-CoA dehydrogenase / enoyl-CoA hydratase / 3-hydroxybutyryl-CoA epimerase / enoyl-CoA isomerase